MSEKIKLGLFGVGHLGKVHLKLLKELAGERDDLEIIGINDISPDKLKEISKEFEITAYENRNELIEKIIYALREIASL